MNARSFADWAGTTAALAVVALLGCKKPTEPGARFPSFALVDVNPHTPTSGQTLTETWLSGPAAVAYFGWAT